MKREFMCCLQYYAEKLFGWFPLRIVRKSTLEYFYDMQYRFGCVLDHATGSMMSKTNYTKEAMYQQINEHVNCLCEEAFQEGREVESEKDNK